MYDFSSVGRRIATAGIALSLFVGLFVTGASGASAHARYDYSEPDVSSLVADSPFVLRTYYTQELMSASTVRVLDESGTQVDMADGHVDLDDPDRKSMVVSLPGLPAGFYTVEWSTVSADDGDSETGTFTIGVGMAPNGAAPSDAGFPASAS
jgi:methionine-rich copper-binding protein CopC